MTSKAGNASGRSRTGAKEIANDKQEGIYVLQHG